MVWDIFWTNDFQRQRKIFSENVPSVHEKFSCDKGYYNDQRHCRKYSIVEKHAVARVMENNAAEMQVWRQTSGVSFSFPFFFDF